MNLKDKRRRGFCRQGMTLIEMSLVILVLLGMAGVFFASTRSIGDWQKGKEVSSILRGVEEAQRQFLADNPQRAVSSLTDAEVASYLPGSPAALPTMVGLDKIPLTADITVSPPIARTGNGDAYDPTGSTSDSLWDVGK